MTGVKFPAVSLIFWLESTVPGAADAVPATNNPNTITEADTLQKTREP
jgi:hypothetical protein